MNLVLSVDELRKLGTPRLHGNGFLQMDLGDSNCRLNIWPYPAISGQTVSTQMHNHGFGFESQVLLGRVVNRAIDVMPVPSEQATHVVYQAKPRGICPTCRATHEHAVQFLVANSTFLCLNKDCEKYGNQFRSEDTLLLPVETQPFVFAKTRSVHIVETGDFYTQAALDYRESMAPREWVVTRMSKTHTTGVRPSVLVEKGLQPDNDFNRHLSVSEDTLWQVVDEACQRIAKRVLG